MEKGWKLTDAVLLGLAGEALYLFVIWLSLYSKAHTLLINCSQTDTTLITTSVCAIVTILLLGPVVHWIAVKRGYGGLARSVGWHSSCPAWRLMLIMGAVLAVPDYWISARRSVTGYPASHLAFTVALYVLANVLLQPVIEEFYFRGVLQAAVGKSIGTVGSVVVVALLFDWVHVNSRLLVLPISICLGIVRVRTKSIVPCLLLHASYNASLLVVNWFL